MRGMTLAMGVAPQAGAVTLAVVLSGWAAGAAWANRRVIVCGSPMRFAATLMALGSVLALLFLTLDPIMDWLHGQRTAGGRIGIGVHTLAEIVVALLVLFPPVFCFGGAFPVLIRTVDSATRSRAYAMYTAGSVVGAASGGFLFLRWMSLPVAYGVATIFSMFVAGWLVCQQRPLAEEVEVDPAISNVRRWPLALAAASGFLVLAMEVLWSRMIMLVSDNSSYAFSLVLIIFLAALAVGAWLAGRLQKHVQDIRLLLGLIFSVVGLVLCCVPWLFYFMTDGLTPLDFGGGWWSYLISLASLIIMLTFPVAVVTGVILPLLMDTTRGARLGQLLAVNTVGAVLGSMIAGFVLLDVLGLWRSIYLLAALATLIGLTLVWRSRPRVSIEIVLPAFSLGLLAFILSQDPVPLQAPITLAEDEQVIEITETGHAVVSVVQSQNDLQFRVNNAYTVGTARGRMTAAWMGHLPLLLHPEARSVLFLGMGTGVTAAAALEHPVEQITVCELIPALFTLSEKHFGDYVGALHQDRRVIRYAGDGRILFRTKLSKQDLVIADLFVPWKSGVGTLYSREHYARVRDRLNETGMFVQWLPLFQMSETEVGSVVRTLQEIFPQVTLWRGTFDDARPILGVVGHNVPQPLDLRSSFTRLKMLTPQMEGTGAYTRFWKGVQGIAAVGPKEYGIHALLLYYAGNAASAKSLFAAYPVNHEQRPFVEMEAPRLRHASETMTGGRLISWYGRVLGDTSGMNDPFLSKLRPEQKRFVEVGLRMVKQGSRNH